MKTPKLFYVLAIAVPTLLIAFGWLTLDYFFGSYYMKSKLNALTADEREYRIPNTNFHHGFKENYSTDQAAWGQLRYPLRTNSLGFKDESNRRIDKVPVRTRYVFIGDSFTEGIGLPWQDTFVGMFAAARPDLEVLNAAVASYTPTLYYQKLKWMLDQGYEIDGVIVYIDISDIQDEAFSYERDKNGFFLPEVRRCEWTRYHEYLKDLSEKAKAVQEPQPEPRKTLGFRWQRFKERFPRRFPVSGHIYATLTGKAKASVSEKPVAPVAEDINEIPLNLIRGMWTYFQRDDLPCYGAQGVRGGIAKATESMTKLANLLKEKRIPLSVGVYPWPDQLVYDKENSVQVQIWQNWCAMNQCHRFLNHFPDFFAKQTKSRWPKEYFIENDAHFNALGNRVIADKVIKELAR